MRPDSFGSPYNSTSNDLKATIVDSVSRPGTLRVLFSHGPTSGLLHSKSGNTAQILAGAASEGFSTLVVSQLKR